MTAHVEAVAYAGSSGTVGRLSPGARALALFLTIVNVNSVLALVAVSVTPGRVLLAAGAAVGSAALLLNGVGKSRRVGIFSGELSLLSVFLLLATAAPHFRDHSMSVGTVNLALAATVVGLLGGAGALLLSRSTEPSRTPDQAWMLATGRGFRDGEILIVGTLLLAVATSAASIAHVPVPHWNWSSFVGITVPGMFLIIGGFASSLARRRRSLIVGGLAIMLYGSAANLSAGRNAFGFGPHLTLTGILVWFAGIAVLLWCLPRGRWQATFGVAAGLLAVALSERGFTTGVSPWSWGHGNGLLVGTITAATSLPVIAAALWRPVSDGNSIQSRMPPDKRDGTAFDAGAIKRPRLSSYRLRQRVQT